MTLLDHEVLRSLERDLGGLPVLQEVVRTYLELLPERRGAVHEAADRDLLRLRRVAHTLGSASAVVGAVELRDACRELEAVSPESGSASLGRLVAAWAASCARTQDALSTWLAGA